MLTNNSSSYPTCRLDPLIIFGKGSLSRLLFVLLEQSLHKKLLKVGILSLPLFRSNRTSRTSVDQEKRARFDRGAAFKMYPSHWVRDHRHRHHHHHQDQHHHTIHRSPTPNRNSHLHDRKRRFDEEDDRPIYRGKSRPINTFPSQTSHPYSSTKSDRHLGPRHKTSSRSPPPSRKKSRFDDDKPLPLRPRSAVSPPPLSADAARLFGILKEDPGRRLDPSITSSVP